MDYIETVDYLCNQLPFFQKQGKKAYKANLDNTLSIANHFGHPETKFKSIHIAGTNGKGSTAHMLSSILQESGLKVGLYTSPHLLDFRERIKINGQKCEPEFVVDFVQRCKSLIDEIQPTFFELTTIMAFDYFAHQKVDIAVIETGLGGRLDCTNIIQPLVSVITSISIDHVGILGDTITKIAQEKGGIIKENTPIILSQNPIEVESVIQNIAIDKKAKLTITKPSEADSYFPYCSLKGEHQKKNLATVIATCKTLSNFDLNSDIIIKGLENMEKNDPIQARYQTIQDKPKVIVDSGHNEEAFKTIVAQLEKEDYRKLRIVIGFMEDKEVDQILRLLPKEATYYFTAPKMPRSLYPTHLKEKAKGQGLKGEEFGKVKLAYQTAIKESLNNDLVFIGGSTFTVAEVLKA